MNTDTDKVEHSLESELSNLRKRYRSMQAPPDFAGRILARVSDQQPAWRRWQPVYAALPVVIAVVAIFSVHTTKESPVLTTLKRPSLATLSRLVPSKPTNVLPNLSRIRTVPKPSMPQKPALRQGNDPHTYRDLNPLHKFEENDYEYV